MALVGLGVISIFKCKRHYKSRDIGEGCTKDRACTEDDDRRITAIYYSLWVSLCLLYFLCTFHEVSLQIASLGQAKLIYSLSSPPAWNSKNLAIISFFIIYHVHVVYYFSLTVIFCALIHSLCCIINYN